VRVWRRVAVPEATGPQRGGVQSGVQGGSGGEGLQGEQRVSGLQGAGPHPLAGQWRAGSPSSYLALLLFQNTWRERKTSSDGPPKVSCNPSVHDPTVKEWAIGHGVIFPVGSTQSFPRQHWPHSSATPGVPLASLGIWTAPRPTPLTLSILI
jgi:hypothetical protein